jgi:outer membrane scaffolding protein for murein synthesis (MipA/OmpV family)
VSQLTRYHRRILTFLLASFVAFGVPAQAQDVAEIPLFDAPSGTAALGGGLRFGQSPYLAPDNEDQRQVDLIPMYLYEGRYLFARGTQGGVHFVNNDLWELNLLLRYRFQKLDPSSNSFYEGLEKREQSLDGGISMRFRPSWGEINASYVWDTLNRHNGEEAQLSYRYNFLLGPWTVSPFIGWSWNDANLTNYYFGVSEAEALPDRPAYAPGESQWLRFGVNTSYQLTDRILLFANIGFAGTDTEVLESPLIEEAAASAAFIGGTYVFGNARRSDYIMSEERKGEWSWRINYGYQADGNIVSEIDQGDFSRSSVAEDARIGGITLGKLLSEGPRVDFVGKVAAFRHFEEDEGNGNFWSYAAFIMARGKGYSPWSKEEWFRWGFGFGMSYAETVPIAEQRKQTGDGAKGNTSHFLNYLEMTLDFPLRRISKANWLQRCYAGLSIVHRSGIFGTSDILGDVAGGADWITAHLECTR